MFSPGRWLRSKIGAFADGLESGRMSRRLSGWVPSRVHVNTLIQASGATTLARARYLVRNNPYAVAAVECFASNLVGDGITPSWNAGEGQAELKTEIQSAWNDWVAEADADGLADFYGLQRRVARELFIAGEVFVRMRPRYLSDGLTVPLQLQLLPAEMLPIEYTQDLANGNRVRQGIEFDRIGRRVAYHFWKVHPGDSTESPKFGETTRVPAGQVLHVYDPVEAGQVRGLSRLTPAIVSLWTLDAYDDAELERKKTAALFAAFIKRADPDGEMFDKAAEQKAKEGDGVATVKLEPGVMQVLLPGEEIQTTSPADVGPNYEAFQYRALLRVCAALGLAYSGVTGDLVRANYANQRAALIEMRRRMVALQHGVVVFQLGAPVWRSFMNGLAFVGRVKLPGYVDNPRPYHKATHIAPRWEWVDPLKDRQAENVAVNAGFKSVSMVIEEEGNDPDEVFRRRAADKARMKELGIEPAGSPSEAPLPNGGIKDEPSPPVRDQDQQS